MSAPPTSELETKAPRIERVSFVRCPLSSSARSRDAKVSCHHRSSDDRVLCYVTERKMRGSIGVAREG